MQTYRAPRWLPGGHAQTIWPALTAPRLLRPQPNYRRERLHTPDGDFIDLDWQGEDLAAPLLVLFHGLEGSSRSHYSLAFAQWAREQDSVSGEALVRMLEHSAKILSDAGLAVDTQLLKGDPKHELLAQAEAWEADAIFIGARGLHHGGRLALGTMASSVAARAHCSVEIVRPG